MTSATVHMTDDLTFSRIVPGLMRLLEWNLTSAELRDWIRACLDIGLTTFDHADIYGGFQCEAVFGSALSLDKSLRDKIQIVTKCGIQLVAQNRPDTYIHHYNTTKEYIIWSAENSLKMLRTDYIDLLLVHRPDPLMDADEIASAFVALKQAGKIRHFGVSNFTTSQFELVQSRLDFPLITNQVEFSVLQMAPLNDGVFDLCQQRRIAPMAWSSFAGGRIFSGSDDQAGRVKAKLESIAEAHHAKIDQIALAWILKHPVNVLPILGTGKLDRIKSAVESLNIDLTHQEWFSLWEASMGHEVP